jgi:hypothetical protein
LREGPLGQARDRASNRRSRLASHARGRWFEPSGAHSLEIE